METKPFYLYARVSRDDMTCENQKKILEDWAARNGIQNTTYAFEEISSRKTRPEKDKILRAIRSGQAEGVAVVRIDRWARSAQELVMDVQEISAHARFCAITNGFDFSNKQPSASQTLNLQIFAAFAEFERELIRERTLEGLARARAQGKAQGRHPKGCGCGFVSADGKVRHNGPITPIRDEHNKVIGWNKPPPENLIPAHEEAKKEAETPVFSAGEEETKTKEKEPLPKTKADLPASSPSSPQA